MQIEDNTQTFGFNIVEAEADFVGRDEDLRKLEEKWESHRIFILYGLRGVGKSKLAKEFVDRKCKEITQRLPYRKGSTSSFDHVTTDTSLSQSECLENQGTRTHVESNGHHLKVSNDIVQLVSVDVRRMDSIHQVYCHMCQQLNIELGSNDIETDGWQLILNKIKRSRMKYILYFDNTEAFVEGNEWDKLGSLCHSLVRESYNSKIIITSTTRTMFSQIMKVCFSHEVQPLNAHDSKLLLHSVVPEVDLSHNEDAFVKLSEGIPLLILMIGSELNEEVTPQHMEEMLSTKRLKALSREYYHSGDRIADVYTGFIGRLPTVHQRRLSTLEYIPSSFNAGEARAVLDHETDAQTMDETIVSLRRRSMLNYDKPNQRFHIQGILRECLQGYFTSTNIPEIRARYCKEFTSVMQGIAEKLGTSEYEWAVAELVLEHPNLHKLLTEVLYTTEDTYHFFLEIAEKCTNLIEMFLTSQSEAFYNGCLQLADRYGRDTDKATVYIAVGSMATNLIGDFSRGFKNYQSALQILKTQGKSLQLATANQRMGWNLHRQGRDMEAIRYFKTSLNTSRHSGEEFQLVMLQSLNSMGVAHTDLGNFEEAERYHFESLERRKKVLGEDHPFIGATLNNIGCFYEQKGEPHKALEFYLKGIQLKRKGTLPTSSIVESPNNTGSPTAVVESLNNLATSYCELKHWRKAHTYLDEAMDILNAQTIPLKDALSQTYHSRGKVYMSEQKITEASEMFKKASEIRETLSPSSAQYFESLLHLAKANQRQNKPGHALKTIMKVLQHTEETIKVIPQTTIIAECLECLANIYEDKGDLEKCEETFGRLQSELMRLENFHLSQSNEIKVELIRSQLQNLTCKLNTRSSNT